MAKRNYKVYADLGLSTQFMVRQLSVLDTGAAPNLIHKELIPPTLQGNIRYGETLDIADANNNPLKTVGYISLLVRLGTYLVELDFVVCESLAAPVIFGCDFCDRFVDSIRPRARIVEMADGSTIPIVRKPLKRATRKRVPLPAAQEATDTNPVSTKLRICKSIAIPAESQVWVSVVTKQHGIHVIQPLPSLYTDRQLALANGVVSVESDNPFKVLVANFGKTTQWLTKNQALDSVLPQPTAIVPTKIPVAHVLGLTDPKEGEGAAVPEDVLPTKGFSPSTVEPKTEDGKGLPPGCEQKDPVEELGTLDLEHVPVSHRKKLRDMLREFTPMWDGSLGKIGITEHRIDLLPGTRPIAQHPYRAGPKAREEERTQVEKLLRAGVIEPAQSSWASPVVLVPKPDGSWRFCIGYRRLYAVTVKDIYPIPRMDEYIDSLGSATLFTALDANWGYWQVPIRKDDRDQTSFVCHQGLYRFNRMPFGLTNAPAKFQRAIDVLLARFKWNTCLVYLDDIIVFSNNLDDHLVHVRDVMRVLRDAGIVGE